MKRLWIGVGLLSVVLVLGIWISSHMERIHAPGAEKLKQAAVLALEDDWVHAEALTNQARSVWQEKWMATAAVSNHEPMDTIDALFAELEVYAACKDSVSYSGTCAHLSELLKAVGKEHGLKWWNLL